MAIADWIRDATEKRRRQIEQEAYDRGYVAGYDDRDSGKPRRRPGNTPNNPQQPDDKEPGRSE